MGVFDQGPSHGTPYHLRPPTREELETHRRLIAKTEATKRASAKQSADENAGGETKKAGAA